jgi:diguanylate cyclase (GGDEF)-like protein
MNFFVVLKKAPQPLLFVMYGVFIYFLWLFDTITGPDLSILTFYLVPVIAATWLSGKPAGIIISILSAAAWYFSDINTHFSYSHPMVPYWNMTVGVTIFLVVVELLSRLKKTLVLEMELARKDELTGAANRRSFFESTQIEIDRTHRYKHPFTLAYIDIDDFKRVNDMFGHEEGDRVLRIFSSVLIKNIRSTDVLGRIGGDEFVLLLSETGYDQAHTVIEKLSDLLQERLDKGKLPVTFSIGVVTFLRPPSSVDDLLKKVDGVMYTVKREGKNTIKHITWKESASAH